MLEQRVITALPCANIFGKFHPCTPAGHKSAPVNVGSQEQLQRRTLGTLEPKAARILLSRGVRPLP